MRIGSVIKARALAVMELGELNRDGKVRFSECVAPIVQRYEFETFPTKPEDFNEETGVKFVSGKFKGSIIESLVIYSGAIYVDGVRNTAESKEMLLDLANWGREELGLTFSEKQIRRWAYISDLMFYPDFPWLDTYSSPLEKLARKTSAVTEEIFGGLEYRPSRISIAHDPMKRNHNVAEFSITHRINTSFDDNVYFSEAPLPTDLHIKFIEEFEEDIRAQNASR